MSEPTPTELLDHAQTLVSLRGRIAEALTEEHYRRAHERIVASPEEHQAGFADVAMAVVQPELDRRDTEIRRLREALALADGVITDSDAARQAERKRAEQAEATVARVRQALDDADWGGPERGEVVAEIRAVLDRSDLPDVREFAAGFDPREEGHE